eukprot:CAMPEP_0168725514 /NCGR_PEP_ID=MMETSP0724-20121128/4194_1 /TAXON_ID=265536 /ORGANISM="Amphiprora sp., Strain CCMP467" /LENGTH=179 /DNA_ID=CAMNT_0008772303 /DNA_START=52 /DNA_END=588 /DNA_ORIENTATION=+
MPRTMVLPQKGFWDGRALRLVVILLLPSLFCHYTSAAPSRIAQGESPFLSHRRDAFSKPTTPWVILRGGAATNPSSPKKKSFSSSSSSPRPTARPDLDNVDWSGLSSFCRSAAQRVWAMEWVRSAAHTSPADVVKGVSSVLKKPSKTTGKGVVEPQPTVPPPTPTSNEQQSSLTTSKVA